VPVYQYVHVYFVTDLCKLSSRGEHGERLKGLRWIGNKEKGSRWLENIVCQGALSQQCNFQLHWPYLLLFILWALSLPSLSASWLRHRRQTAVFAGHCHEACLLDTIVYYMSHCLDHPTSASGLVMVSKFKLSLLFVWQVTVWCRVRAKVTVWRSSTGFTSPVHWSGCRWSLVTLRPAPPRSTTLSRWKEHQKYSRTWSDCISVVVVVVVNAFSALILLVGRQEEHSVCKNWVTRCWCGYLSEARCRLFAYGLVQLMPLPSPKPQHFCLI